jgi:hypothetical protein
MHAWLNTETHSLDENVAVGGENGDALKDYIVGEDYLALIDIGLDHLRLLTSQ